MYFLLVSHHLLFLFFLLSSCILFSTSLFHVSILLGIETCSLLFSTSCCLFLSLLLLLLVQPTLVISRFFSLQCSLASCNMSIFLLSCLLFLLHTWRLVAPLLSNMFSPSLLDGNFFWWQSLSSRSIFWFFSSFRAFVLQTHFSLLVLSLLSFSFLLVVLYYLFFRPFLSCYIGCIDFFVHWVGGHTFLLSL